MRLSIVIPMYNSEKYIKECLDSILGQIDDKVEIILVNDGSKDDTEKICKSYNSNHIKYFWIENHGVSYARNYGLKHAKGEYIMFVDSDDSWTENTYALIQEHLNNNIDLIVFGYEKIYKNKRVCVSLKNEITHKKIDENIFFEAAVSGYLWNKVFKKNIIDKEKLCFNKNITFCEDLVFVSEYIKKINTKKVMYIEEPLYLYRIRKSGVSINFYNSKNESIIMAYDYLVKMFSNDKVILSKIKEDYLFALRRFGTKKCKILLEEKNVISNMNMKNKLKYFFIKRFRKLYIYIRNLYYKNNKNIFE